ncbi:hypothetical protein PAPYR_9274 [Paratrimastix pyriformis]|uniref:Uncharacterized protein n=1 Tax=Paratrimastix pyriformis TaxID=342808 RepID=A0ABQ8UFY4_9EUKA|nr:hypothetical protein PAPYR_9274 [Paratrimastix pyriformis]
MTCLVAFFGKGRFLAPGFRCLPRPTQDFFFSHSGYLEGVSMFCKSWWWPYTGMRLSSYHVNLSVSCGFVCVEFRNLVRDFLGPKSLYLMYREVDLQLLSDTSPSLPILVNTLTRNDCGPGSIPLALFINANFPPGPAATATLPAPAPVVVGVRTHKSKVTTRCSVNNSQRVFPLNPAESR